MLKNTEVSLKIPTTLYAEYKGYCKSKGVLPAHDLKNYIRSIVTDEISILEDLLKLACANLHMKNTPANSVPFAGTEENRIKLLAKKLIETDADIICANEFAPQTGDVLLEIMDTDYQAYFNPEYNKIRDRRAWCVTVVFVKKNKDISFIPWDKKWPRSLRQVAGELTFRGKTIDLLAIHVLPVRDTTNSRHVELKKEHLTVIDSFTKSAKHPVLIMGDLNTDLDNGGDVGDANLRKYLPNVCDITPITKSWHNKRLLRILCNPEMSIVKAKKESKSEVVDLGVTDHAIIISQISVKEI